ncbi:pathogen-associated molecular patterns-induced protein A70 [Andrographis paniculata]|uniref:pathogen-associated molecular patterns-induced protein A70 n=1 Tax=Andrographis paniculata TaxID=175694 RepID=UPI0021E7FC47|nr:pathogen-associated molecular patterns-induced protein A70 [Andrographis paniculata]
MSDQSPASSSPISIWTAINSWFTPTVLFILLNLVIATIAFTSTTKHRRRRRHPPPPSAARSPSLLHRLKTLTFDPHSRSADPLPQNDAVSPDSQNLLPHSEYFFPEPFETDSGDFDGGASQQTTAGDVSGAVHVSRSKSDTRPASGEIPTKLPATMRKSASMKSAFGHFKEEDIVISEERRPATATAHHDGDEEVDAKAADFINRFKEQLKLQRVDSIVRYREMIRKGNSGRGDQ